MYCETVEWITPKALKCFYKQVYPLMEYLSARTFIVALKACTQKLGNNYISKHANLF